MRIRLISLTGEVIAEAEIEISTDAVIFSDRVFIQAFSIASFEYFREVKATRVRNIETLRAYASFAPVENGIDERKI